jgi:transposase-like protein
MIEDPRPYAFGDYLGCPLKRRLNILTKRDHDTIWRWVQRYAPLLNQRVRRELRHPNCSWRVDETYVRVAGKWTYPYSEKIHLISCA